MKKPRILVSLITDDNYYHRQHAAAAQNAAAPLGVELTILYSANDALRQSEELLTAIHAPADRRPDGIIVAPVGTTLGSVARSAVAAGIGWAVLNRDCEYLSELRLTSSVPVFAVSTDQAEIGRIQGRQLAALLPQGGLVLYILGPAGSPIVQYRRSWMESTKPANVKVRTVSADWTQQSGYKAVAAWLALSTSHTTPIGVIAAQCDDVALGARKAFEEHTTGAEQERWTSLPFLGVDGCPGAGQEWVKRGLLTSTVVNPPTAGTAVATMARAIQSGVEPPEFTLLAPTSFPSVEALAAIAASSGQS